MSAYMELYKRAKRNDALKVEPLCRFLEDHLTLQEAWNACTEGYYMEVILRSLDVLDEELEREHAALLSLMQRLIVSLIEWEDAPWSARQIEALWSLCDVMSAHLWRAFVAKLPAKEEQT